MGPHFDQQVERYVHLDDGKRPLHLGAWARAWDQRRLGVHPVWAECRHVLDFVAALAQEEELGVAEQWHVLVFVGHLAGCT